MSDELAPFECDMRSAMADLADACGESLAGYFTNYMVLARFAAEMMRQVRQDLEQTRATAADLRERLVRLETFEASLLRVNGSRSRPPA